MSSIVQSHQNGLKTTQTCERSRSSVKELGTAGLEPSLLQTFSGFFVFFRLLWKATFLHSSLADPPPVLGLDLLRVDQQMLTPPQVSAMLLLLSVCGN